MLRVTSSLFVISASTTGIYVLRYRQNYTSCWIFLRSLRGGSGKITLPDLLTTCNRNLLRPAPSSVAVGEQYGLFTLRASAAIRSTSPIKPMSSMRSASSSTRNFNVTAVEAFIFNILHQTTRRRDDDIDLSVRACGQLFSATPHLRCWPLQMRISSQCFGFCSVICSANGCRR